MLLLSLPVLTLVAATSPAAGPLVATNLFDKLKQQLDKVPVPSGTSSSQPGKPGDPPPPVRPYSQEDLTAHGLDIHGLRLGMSMEEVRAFFDANHVQIREGRHAAGTASGVADQISWTTPGDATGTLGSYEVIFTSEATPRAYMVRRHVAFNAATFRKTLNESVLEKYGKPSVSKTDGLGRQDHMRWWFGPAQNTTTMGCGGGQGNLAVSQRTPLKDINDRVRESISEVDRCGISYLKVAASGDSPEYVSSVSFTLMSPGMLELSWREVGDKVKANLDNAAAEKQSEAQAAPKPAL